MYHLAAIVEELTHVIELVVVVDYIVAVVVVHQDSNHI